MRNDGWYLRQDIIWHKPNPMPESVKIGVRSRTNIYFCLVKIKSTTTIMKQSKNPQKIGEQETEQKENTTTKEQDYNRIADLQNHIQQKINDLSGQ